MHKRTTGRSLLSAMLGTLCATTALLPGAESGGPPAGTDRPGLRNLVFILIDDLGAIDLACTGSTYYRTPHIDALAARGMLFTQAYTASPVCSPTRASIMTGRYPHRIGLTTFIPGPNLPWARLSPPAWTPYLRSAEHTYAELLHDAGRYSLHAGKWHMGAVSPTQHGFDEVYDNQGSATDPKGVHALTNRVCAFIKQQRERPFCAVLSHHSVHVPLAADAGTVARWSSVPAGANGQDNPTMAAMIAAVDDSVGQVLAELRQQGLEQETAVVFFSDNGGLTKVRTAADQPAVVATSNAPLRGGKSQLYEGGIRVPLIIAAPGVTAPGTRCDVPVISNDLAPTFLALLGAPAAPRQHLDGLDLTPLLRGGTDLPRRNLFWHYPHYQSLPPHAAIRSGNWKLVHHFTDARDELFELTNDPGEAKDLSGELPETTALLHRFLFEHLKQTGAGLPNANPAFDPQRERTSSPSKPPGAELERHPNRQPAVMTSTETGAQRDLVAELRSQGSLEAARVDSSSAR